MYSKEKLEAQNIELNNLNKTKTKFLSIIAHDLKSPFTTIIGFSELLLKHHDRFDEKKILEFIKLIHKGSTNVFKLLENLLTWSRSQNGLIECNLKDSHLHSLSVDYIESIKQSANNKSTFVINDIPKDIYVKADRNMVSVIVRNLLSNAIKFTPNEGKINITAQTITHKEKNKKIAEIKITDSGVGMTEDVRLKLFDIAQNTSTPGTNNEQGTGLGLVLCKEFVEKQGGEIFVISEEGKGSEFVFTLPLVENNF